MSLKTTLAMLLSLAPAAVTDLDVAGSTSNSVTIQWTAPLDATGYDVRWSLTSIETDADFDSAENARGEPMAAGLGESQSMVVTGLPSSSIVYIAMKATGKRGDYSELSNVIIARTLPPEAVRAKDPLAPEPVTDLAVTVATESVLGLSWTMPPDAERVDVRWSAAPITNDAEFAAATVVPGTAVTGLVSGATYYFVMKTADAEGDWSDLSNLAVGETLAVPAANSPKAVKCGLLGMELLIVLGLMRLRRARK